MKKQELDKILELHKLWITSGKVEGERANLENANLKDVNLVGAYLAGANLENTCIKAFNLGKNFGFSWKNQEDEIIVKIGCEEHTLDHWLDNYYHVGKKNGYAEDQIYNYGLMLKILKEMK